MYYSVWSVRHHHAVHSFFGFAQLFAMLSVCTSAAATFVAHTVYQLVMRPTPAMQAMQAMQAAQAMQRRAVQHGGPASTTTTTTGATGTTGTTGATAGPMASGVGTALTSVCGAVLLPVYVCALGVFALGLFVGAVTLFALYVWHPQPAH